MIIESQQYLNNGESYLRVKFFARKILESVKLVKTRRLVKAV